MKILWFSNTPSLGERQLTGSAMSGGWIKSLDGQIQNRVELYVAFHYNQSIEPYIYGNTKYFPIGPKFGILSKIIERYTGDINGQVYLHRYLEIVNEVNPDIIHIHGTENSFGVILGKTDKPIIISIQGIVTEIERKFYTIDSRIKTRFFKKSYRHYAKLAKFEKSTLSRSLYLISKSQWSNRVLSILAPNAKVFRLDNILRESFYSVKWNNHYKPEDRLLIVSISSDRYFKGFETICESISILTKLGISFKWQVAGIDPKSDFIIKIKKKLKSTYPSENLELLGRLSEPDIINMLLRSHFYVMTSHIENSPNNLCEAMILGIPCIAAFSGGTSSMLANDHEGILVPDNDPIALSGAILEYVNEPPKAMAYGINARARALARHDAGTIVNALLSIYENVLYEDNLQLNK